MKFRNQVMENSFILESRPSTGAFFGIILATNRPKNIIDFFDNLVATAADSTSFEVLIRADSHDLETINAIKSHFDKVPFRICLLVRPNEKLVYQMHKSYNELAKERLSSSVYFVANLTDEIRFRSLNWDELIKKYIGFYPDGIFRLVFSRNMLRNYYHYNECLHLPDNYPIVTKKWLELTDGWGDLWGTDTWQQCLTYYLGLCRIPSAPNGIFRSVPLYHLDVDGQEDGVGMPPGKRRQYHEKVVIGAYLILLSSEARLNFSRLATRLAAHIAAYENGLSGGYILKENFVFNKSTVLETNNQKEILSINYISITTSFNLLLKYWLYSFMRSTLGYSAADKIKNKCKRIYRSIANISAKIRYLLRPIRKAQEPIRNYCLNVLKADFTPSIMQFIKIWRHFFIKLNFLLHKLSPPYLLLIVKISSKIKAYACQAIKLFLSKKLHGAGVKNYLITRDSGFINANYTKIADNIDSVL